MAAGYWTSSIVAACALGVWASLANAQNCGPYWVKPDPYNTALAFGGDALRVFDDGSGPALFCGGRILPGDRFRFTRWTGHRWDILDQGVPLLRSVELFAVLDDGSGPALYGGGADEAVVWHMWKWNGSRWVDPPVGFSVISQTEYKVPYCSHDDGTGMAIFGIVRDTVASNMAKWYGGSWHPIGSLSGSNLIMEVFDVHGQRDVYACGYLGSVAGVPGTRGIARWRNQQWESLGGGLQFYAAGGPTVCVHDGGQGSELYVASVQSAGGITVSGGIVKWDGQQWVSIPQPAGPVHYMVSLREKGGTFLYANGNFTMPGGSIKTLARFDGQAWTFMPLQAMTEAMCAFQDDPRGPSIFSNGGGYVFGLGQFVACSERTCYADADNNQKLNVNDFMWFLNRFSARDPYGDCTADTVFNAQDFVCYLGKFAAGCW